MISNRLSTIEGNGFDVCINSQANSIASRYMLRRMHFYGADRTAIAGSPLVVAGITVLLLSVGVRLFSHRWRVHGNTRGVEVCALSLKRPRNI
jgi:hypothetical protein